jgi:UDP-N-acetylmuramoyl-L-alanyl-D-glutamate--2,6-diaminopimelate ligase
MKISEIVRDVVGARVLLDAEIRGISYDSRTVGPGDVFFAVVGTELDGHAYIGQAVEKGAAGIVVQDLSKLPCVVRDNLHNKSDSRACPVGVALVPDSRVALSRAARTFYHDPSKDLLVVGITGTKGKTTTCHLVKSVLDAAGEKTGLIGTVHNIVGSQIRPVTRTTPESVELHALQRDMVDVGCTAVAMEVSSHALALGRVADIRFNVALMTNIGRDHLDFHGTMDSYVDTKATLFRMLEDGKDPKAAVLNADEPYLGRFLQKIPKDKVATVLYGFSEGADVRGLDPEYSDRGTVFTLCAGTKRQRIRVSLPGRFNVMNALAAAAVGYGLGTDFEAIVGGLEGARGVKGRLEVVPGMRGFSVWVDYAHTPESLKDILATARDMAKGRVIVVFGCGGDRDRGKRPIMGRVAGDICDLVIITDDNPRTENEDQILDDIEVGLRETPAPYLRIKDRREAIKEAVTAARVGDIVVIAGKGHETYQIFKEETVHFDDAEEALRAATCFCAGEGPC